MSGCQPGIGDEVERSEQLVTTLVAMHFNNVATLSTGWAGTQPLAGFFWLRRLIVRAAPAGSPSSPSAFFFGLRSEVPTSTDEMLEASLLFPEIGGKGGTDLELWSPCTVGEAALDICGRFPVNCGGRRIVGQWRNRFAGDGDLQALFVLERA